VTGASAHAGQQSEDADPNWWRQAVFYQIYPRSFADHNGDGVGDLRGITDRLSHLVGLGVDAVWLSPFYPSALADGGYDVDDHQDVDPRLGTLADFDALVAALHGAGIKVMVDVVPNHTSDRHAWFQEALAGGRGSPSRARYHFRDGRGPGGMEPPNDWQSVFGGSAWAPVGNGQWYLHIFAPEQPDLNWDHPDVHAAFLRTIRFWSDRGVDGFRVDVAHGLVKDLSEPYRPQAQMGIEHRLGGQHPWWDRDEVHDIYAEWRAVFDEYDPPRMAVAEAWAPADRRPRYASPRGLGQAFNFDLLEQPWDAASFRTAVTINLALAATSGTSSTWVLSNHDVVRHASRYGLPDGTPEVAGKWLTTDGRVPEVDSESGLCRARAATLFMLALPGAAYLYQGEELGLAEVADLSAEDLQDPAWERSGHTVKGRDGCRVPLPWTCGGPSYGFGDGASHLPQPDWFAAFSVEAQEADPGSTLHLYRAALRLRRVLQGAERLDWVEAPSEVLHFVRPGGWHCVTNFGAEPVGLPPGEVLMSSAPVDAGRAAANSTVWLRAR
jgi:alpha-glucosidase